VNSVESTVLNITETKSAAVGTKIVTFGGIKQIVEEQNPALKFNNFYNDTIIFDTETHTLRRFVQEDGPQGRGIYGMASDGQRFVYMWGGLTFNYQGLDDFWRFDADTEEWEQIFPVNAGPNSRAGPGMTYAQGKIYLHAGSHDFPLGLDDLWIYNIATNSWSNQSTPVPVRAGHSLSYVASENSLIAFSGEYPAFGGGGFLGLLPRTDIWQYKLNTNTWVLKSGATEPSVLHYADVVYKGVLHIHGGDLGQNCVNDLIVNYTSLYRLKDDKWVAGYIPRFAGGPSLKGGSMACVKKFCYLIGGYTTVCDNTRNSFFGDHTIWRYDPTNVYEDLALASHDWDDDDDWF